MMQLKSLAFAAALSAGLALTACSSDDKYSSGGGGNMNASQATINSGNARNLAETAAIGAKQAVTQSNAPRDAAGDKPADVAAGITAGLLDGARQAGPRQTITGDCGGSATIDSDNSGNSTIVYNNFCTNGVVSNGTVNVNVQQSGASTTSYNDFTISYNGETYTLNMTVSCDANANCTYSEDFTGPDGETYRIEGGMVSGDGNSGYSVSATVYDPTYGAIEISGGNLTFNCDEGQPGTGSITLSGDGGSSASVGFDSCISYTVTIDGVANSYDW